MLERELERALERSLEGELEGELEREIKRNIKKKIKRDSKRKFEMEFKRKHMREGRFNRASIRGRRSYAFKGLFFTKTKKFRNRNENSHRTSAYHHEREI